MTEHLQKEAHSRFGGSGAARWLACPASVALIGAIPPMVDNEFQREGKIAHALAEYCLRRGDRDARAYCGTEFHPWFEAPDEKLEITKALADAVQVYLDEAWDLIDAAGPDGRHWIEVRFALDLPAAQGEAFGTADLGVYAPAARRLTVIDYKHGAGVNVGAEENAQGKFYAVGALQEVRRQGCEVDDVEVVIVQPNDWRNGIGDLEPVRRWLTSAVELDLFSAELEEAIEKARQSEQLLAGGVSVLHLMKTGDHCGFCDAAAVCPARKAEVLDLAGVESLNDITPARMADVSLLDPADLANARRAAKVMVAWAKQVNEYIDSLLRQGISVPGTKLVEKKARREWVSADEEIAGYLSLVYGLDEEKLRPPTLVTITEAERQLKAELDPKAFKDAKEDLTLKFTVKESSGLTVVDDTDPREAVNAVQSDFGSVNLSDAA